MGEQRQWVLSPTNQWILETIYTTVPGDSPTYVVYKEGGVAAGFVFAHFADAVDAINVGGVPGVLFVDGSLAQPVIPAGIYDLGMISLSEYPGQMNVSLNLDDGAKLHPAPSFILGGLSLYSFSSQPIIDQPNLTLWLKDGSWLQTSGAGPFIHAGPGATVQIFLEESSYLAGSAAGSTAPIISSDLTSNFTGINIGLWSDVGLGALVGSGTMEANLLAPSSTIEAQLSASHLTVFDANHYPPSTTDFANFFALMPGDNSATIAINTAFLFPQDGEHSAAASVTRLSNSTFQLATVGQYQVSFQASVAEAAQVGLRLNGALVLSSVVGRATGTNQIVINTVIKTTLANEVLEVINANSAAALTLTPSAGGTNSVSANLLVNKLS